MARKRDLSTVPCSSSISVTATNSPFRFRASSRRTPFPLLIRPTTGPPMVMTRTLTEVSSVAMRSLPRRCAGAGRPPAPLAPVAGSVHDEAGGHVDILPGHVPPGVGGQEDGQTGDILRVHEAAQGRVLQEHLVGHLVPRPAGGLGRV